MRTWLPAARFADLDASILRGSSLHRLMETRFGAVPSSGRRQIRAVPADPRIAAELGVDDRDPLLLLEGGTFDQHGTPLEWFESWHRSDRVVFDIEAADAADQVRIAPGPSLVSPPAAVDRAGAETGRGLDRAVELAAELRAELDRLRGNG